MPIYEYICEACSETTETIQQLSDPPLTVCLKCGGHLRKKMSAPAFQFKGSGWYVTDYGKGGSKGGDKSGDKGSDKSESSAKSSGSSESSSGGDDSSAGPVKKVETKTESSKPSKSSSD